MSHFNIGTQHARLTFSSATYHDHHDKIHRGHDDAGLLADLSSAIYMCAQAEHEFFHCRNILSSSFGIPFAEMQLLFQETKLSFLRHTPFDIANSDDVYKAIKKSNKQSRYAYYRLYYWTGLKEAINQPTKPLLDLLQGEETGLQSFGCLRHRSDKTFISSDLGQFNVYSLLFQNVQKPTIAESSRFSRLVTLTDMFEAYATWREYQYVCLAAKRFIGSSRQLAEAWLKMPHHTSTAKPVFRRIFKATRCTIEHALPAVLLDIAFNGPACSRGEYAFGEIHPPLRLDSMLAVASELPETLTKLHSTDILDTDYYSDVENFFSSKLGWRPVISNISDAVEMLSKRTSPVLSISTQSEKQKQFRHVATLPFKFGQKAKLDNLSSFIFDSAVTPVRYGKVSPLICEYDDKILMNPIFREHPQLAKSYLLFATLIMFCDTVIHFGGVAGRKVFSNVRGFYAKFADDNDPSFDTFISEHLSYAWPLENWAKRKNAIIAPDTYESGPDFPR